MRVVLLLTFIIACVAGCRTEPQPVSDIANGLRLNVSPFWTITTSNSTICVKSKDEIYLMSGMNPPTGFGFDSSTGANEEAFKTYAWRTNYLVTLSFVPRLTGAELRKIHEERRPYENIQTSSIDVVLGTQRALDRFPLPSFYTADYSIFVEPGPFGKGWVYIYPPEATQQVDNLTNVLMKTFREY